MLINKYIDIVLSMPKTLFFNFRHLPLKVAYKLPVWIYYNTKVIVKGDIVIPSVVSIAMIRIGFHTVPAKSDREQTYVCIKGKVLFVGSAHIGRGSRIFVEEKGELVLGDNFAISANSSILCYKKIIFGNDIQFSWDCIVMDSDTHVIIDQQNNRINDDKEIVFGDKVWIGCNSIVLKGVKIPSNCVIGAGSLVSGSSFQKDSIIVGSPANSIRSIGGWII